MLAALVLLPALLHSGCVSTASTERGEVRGQPFSPAELFQSEGNRFTNVAMRANLDSLLLLADKLYRRNPAEWRKSATTRDAALAQIAAAIASAPPWPALGGKRDVAALSAALTPEFSGDRVAAFTLACADTIVTAHGGKRDFYYLDSIDPQHVHNAARNIETALWVLASRRDTKGQPLLLANEISENSRNLSFEREGGKIIARLDLVASYMTERYRRAVISYAQGMAAAPLLVFLPVR